MTNASAPHLEGLNPPQREAVTYTNGPILVLAGAGSGKTRVLTRRIAHLVLHCGADPSRIFAVTFTNKAAGEMRARLEGLLGEGAQRLWASTFHSAGLRMLRRHASALSYTNNFVVYDEDDSRGTMKALLKEMSVDEKKYPPQFFLRAIDRFKNEFISPEQAIKDAKGYEPELCAEVYEKYQRRLFDAQAMDFGDLLYNALRLLVQEPLIARQYQEHFEWILVDEFQDTNKVQYQLLQILAHKNRQLFVVGDDDQSIYAFRGATIQNILNFEKDFPETKVVKLEQNYRSTSTILTAAHAIIEKNAHRKEKQLWCAGQAGAPIKTYLGADEMDEAYFVAKEIQSKRDAGMKLQNCAIFYRTNAQSRALEDVLISLQIPYRIFGALRFYDRKEIKDVLAYLRLLINERDAQAFMRVVNLPARGVGAQTVQLVTRLAADEQISLLEAAQRLASRSKGLNQFTKLIERFKSESVTVTLKQLVGMVIDETGYRKKLEEMNDSSAVSRLENLRELEAVTGALQLAAATTTDLLRDFLDRVTLTTSSENPQSVGPDGGPPATDYVSLMTLHLAKGLEFPVVFLTGVEEGLLPHYRSVNDPVQVEEERRLCYVGITRAMQELYITRSRKRGMMGGGDANFGLFREPSRFAFDLPKTLLSSCGPDFLSGAWSSAVEESKDDDLADDSDFDDLGNEGSGWSRFQRRKKEKGPRAAFSLLTADQLPHKK